MASGEGLRVDVLGRLSVAKDGSRVDIGPAMVRGVLAVLALYPGRTVPRQTLIHALWGDDAPATCVNLIQGYVSRLRSQLRGGSQTDSGSVELVVWDRTGYRLELATDNVDLARFDELCDAGRLARRSGTVEAAVEAYSAALRCWRGPVLEDLGVRTRELPAAVAVTQRRAGAAVEYADLCLTLGRYSPVIDELQRVAADGSLHEGLYARLMLAMAGAGERSAAIGVYEEIRRRLSEDLGMDPGTELRAAHLTVLRDGDAAPLQESDLDAPDLDAPDLDAPDLDAPVRTTPLSAELEPRRRRRGWRPAMVALATVLAIGSAGVVWVASRPSDSGARAAGSQSGDYAPTGTWDWEDSASLGNTATAKQWASARVYGLVDSDHNAGFRLRKGVEGGVLVALSGTQWKIEPWSGNGASDDFTVPGTGVLVVAISEANVVTITFDGSPVTTYALTGTFPGRDIAPSVWQSSKGVRLTGIRSNVVS